MIASILKIIVAGVYSLEALQAKEDQKQKADAKFDKSQKGHHKRDEESQPTQLLPFRETKESPDTLSYHLMAQVGSLFTDLNFGLSQQVNMSQYSLNFGFLQVCMIFLALKLVQAPESEMSLQLLSKACQGAIVLALIFLQLVHQSNPIHVSKKMISTATALLLSESLQYYYQTSANETMLRFTLLDLVFYESVVTLFISMEHVYMSFLSFEGSAIESQGVINKFANAIIQDNCSPDGEAIGYALLHVDDTTQQKEDQESRVKLLRYNQRLEQVLQCCGTTVIAGSKSESSIEVQNRPQAFMQKKALKERLLNEFRCKESPTRKNNVLILNKEEPQQKTFGSILNEALQRKSIIKDADKGQQIPLLFEKVFSCECHQNPVARSILKTKGHRELKISVALLCNASSSYLLRVERMPNQDQNPHKSTSSTEQKIRKSPKKKVSFNHFEKKEPKLDIRPSQQTLNREQRKLIRSYRRQTRSLDDRSDYNVSSQNASSYLLPNNFDSSLQTVDDRKPKNRELEKSIRKQRTAQKNRRKESNRSLVSDMTDMTELKRSQPNLDTEDGHQIMRDGSLPQSNMNSSIENAKPATNLELFGQFQMQKAQSSSHGSAETPMFNKNRTSIKNQELIDYVQQIMSQQHSNNIQKSIDKYLQQKNLIPSLVEIKNSLDGSKPSQQSSESIESEIQRDKHPATRDKLINKQRFFQGNDKAGFSSSESFNQSVQQQFQGAGPRTEVLHESAWKHHMAMAVVPEEKHGGMGQCTATLEINNGHVWRSDEALKASQFSYKSNLNLTDPSFKTDLQLKRHQKEALSLQHQVCSPKLQFSSGQSSNDASFVRNRHKLGATQKFGSHKQYGNANVNKSIEMKSVYSGRRVRTLIISDKHDSQSRNLLGDTPSLHSHNSAKMEQNIKNQRLFVYKIIHDLRHPTDGLSQGLSQLVKDLAISQLKTDQNLRLSQDKALKYRSHYRVEKAIKQIQSMAHIFVSHESNQRRSSEEKSPPRSHKSFNRLHSLSGGSASSSHQNNSKRFASPLINQKQSQNSFDVSKKFSKNDLLPQNNALQLKNKRRECKSLQINEPSQQHLKQRLSTLRNTFYSIDMKKIQGFLPVVSSQANEVQSLAKPQIQHLGIESKDNQLIGDGKPKSLLSQQQQRRERNSSGNSFQQFVKSSKSLSDIDDSANDNNENVVSGDESAVSIIVSAKEPQKKVFKRDAVSEIVDQKRNDPENKKFLHRPYSLAVDRLIFSSDTMKKIKRDQNSGPLNHSSSQLHIQRSSKSQLTDVLQVIENFKEEARQINKQNRKSDLLIPSKPSHDSENLEVQKEQVLVKQSSSGIYKSLPAKPRNSIKIKETENNILSKESLSSDLDDNKSPHSSSQLFAKKKSEVIRSSNGTSSELNSPQKRKRMQKCIKVLLNERAYLVAMVNKLLQKTTQTGDQLDNMQGQAEMMMILMRDLMNQAELANNTFTMINDYFDVLSLIRRCMNVLRTQASLKNVQLLGPVLYKQSDNIYFHQLYSDERRYGQFILNFLSNSIKFTPRSGQVTVLLNVTKVSDICDENCPLKSKSDHGSRSSHSSAKSAPDKEVSPDSEIDLTNKKHVISPPHDLNSCKEKLIHFEMIFRDTGIGISPENQKKLFLNFGKLHETQDTNKMGVGLGLSICKEIINAHGGSVDIQSELGKGTDFIINLKSKCIVDPNWAYNSSQLLVEQEEEKHLLNLGQKQRQQIEEEDDENSSASGTLTDSENSMSYQKEASLESPLIKRAKAGSPAKLQLSNRQKQGRARQPEQFFSFNDQNQQPASEIIEDHDRDKQELQNQQNDRSLFTIYEKSHENNYEQSQAQVTRCLLANDDMFLLSAYQEALSRHFDQIDTAENGQIALNLVLEQPMNHYSVIVLDIQMPIMDGIEACTKIKAYLDREEEERKHAPVSSVLSRNSSSGVLSSISSPSRKSSDQNAAQNNSNYHNSSQQLSLQQQSRSGLRKRKLKSQQSMQAERTRPPFIYALTSEGEPELIALMKKAGFKTIFNALDQGMIQQLLENAGLVYCQFVEPQQSHDQVFFNPASVEYQSSDKEIGDSNQSGQSSNRQRQNMGLISARKSQRSKHSRNSNSQPEYSVKIVQFDQDDKAPLDK